MYTLSLRRETGLSFLPLSEYALLALPPPPLETYSLLPTLYTGTTYPPGPTPLLTHTPLLPTLYWHYTYPPLKPTHTILASPSITCPTQLQLRMDCSYLQNIQALQEQKGYEEQFQRQKMEAMDRVEKLFPNVWAALREAIIQKDDVEIALRRKDYEDLKETYDEYLHYCLEKHEEMKRTDAYIRQEYEFHLQLKAVDTDAKKESPEADY